jgi:hypothetical protein
MTGDHRRFLGAGLAAAVLLTSFVATAGPAGATTSYWCDQNSHTTPCIESASVQIGSGTPTAITSASRDFFLLVGGPCAVAPDPNGGCQGSVAWAVDPGDTALAADQTFTLSVDLGRFIPSENDTFGVNATVTRSLSGTRLDPDYQATITAQPTLQDDGSSCTESGTAIFLCGEQASSSSIGLFGAFDDLVTSESGANGAASYGLDDWSTSSATGAPLFLGSTPAGTITIPIGNTHLHADGSVVHGEYNAFLPNTLLEYIGIDDPTTITAASLAVTLESGTVTITPSATGVTINLSDIIWPEPPGGGMTAQVSAKAKRARDLPLRIAPGVITPSRAVKVRAHRINSTAAHFTFSGAKPRGSKIRSFHASCSAKHGATKTGKSRFRSHLKVKDLSAGVSYQCKVRAVAKAGHVRWSAPVKLKR